MPAAQTAKLWYRYCKEQCQRCSACLHGSLTQITLQVTAGTEDSLHAKYNLESDMAR